MPPLDVVREDTPGGGRYVARMPGKPDAEMTFTVDGPAGSGERRVMVIHHTTVPSEMGGMGAGKALVAYMVDDVRRRGETVRPLCAFTRAMLGKHPEWQDILADPL